MSIWRVLVGAPLDTQSSATGYIRTGNVYICPIHLGRNFTDVTDCAEIDTGSSKVGKLPMPLWCLAFLSEGRKKYVIILCSLIKLKRPSKICFVKYTKSGRNLSHIVASGKKLKVSYVIFHWELGTSLDKIQHVRFLFDFVQL